MAWGLLWTCGYSPADYPTRIAVRFLGRPAEARYQGSRNEGGGVVSVRFKTAEGTSLSDTTSYKAANSNRKVPGWNRLMALELGGRTVYRVGAGFPFGTFDYIVTLVLALFLIRLRIPEFLGYFPVLARPDALRLPQTALKAADIAAAACAVLGPLMYSAPQACVTGALWFGLRLARHRGYIDFFEVRPLPNPRPLLTVPASEASTLRAAKPKRKTRSFFGLKTSEGWSTVPAAVLALGVLILTLVQADRRYVSVPVPGYRPFGLPLEVWSFIGWALLASAIALAVREFLSAWRESDD